MQIPDEFELLSIFECEPELLDAEIKNLPFIYNQATYRFSNKNEKFVVTISPSTGQVKVKAEDLRSDEVISYFDLQRVDRLEIVADKQDKSSVIITLCQDEILQTLEINFKPRFKAVFKEHYDR
ncbi:hypothetical protein [Paenibacillus sp. Soil522]|uniref:hypothetical protein n=1 Tax=Paenibacillus sp. Soil522 TaxID=1736388 RepID=UPI0006F5B913|nr:hypothetical protein [Paenibacillus sp. Soil522]KRE29647.1 hypothetical protein ASG81_25440 [Paenibacillus sp. Soil522]